MTTTHSNHHSNLLFLLAAAPMGMGCIIVADDGNDTTGAETGQTSGGTAGTDTGTDSTPVTGEGSGSGGSGDSTSRGESTGADSTGADSTGGGAGVCADYAGLATDCMLPYAEYIENNCNYNLAYLETYSAECAMGYADFIGCLSMLSCEELMSDAPCMTELDAFLALGCPTVE